MNKKGLGKQYIIYFILMSLCIFVPSFISEHVGHSRLRSILGAGIGVFLATTGIWGNNIGISFIRPWKRNYELSNYLIIAVGLILIIYSFSR